MCRRWLQRRASRRRNLRRGWEESQRAKILQAFRVVSQSQQSTFQRQFRAVRHVCAIRYRRPFASPSQRAIAAASRASQPLINCQVERITEANDHWPYCNSPEAPASARRSARRTISEPLCEASLAQRLVPYKLLIFAECHWHPASEKGGRGRHQPQATSCPALQASCESNGRHALSALLTGDTPVAAGHRH